jgi:hypothetical protein
MNFCFLKEGRDLIVTPMGTWLWKVTQSYLSLSQHLFWNRAILS